jgi:acyl-coenzyme A synthetase/AMP-(fatty) acid ligase
MSFLGLENLPSSKIAAIDDSGSQITYGELQTNSIKFKELFIQRALVFLFCENTVDAFCLYVACIEANVVPLLLSPQTDTVFIENLIETYSPNYILGPTRVCQNIYGENIYQIGEYEAKHIHSNLHLLADDLALLLPTSGSTGSPKLVRHSYTNLGFSAKNVASFFNLNASDRPVTFLPMYYAMGLSIINSHLIKGACILLVNSSLTDANFWKFIKESAPTSITGVPYSFEILKKLGFFRMNIPSLKLLSQGGGKLSEVLYDDCISFCEKHGLDFIPTYGQTEGSARMAFLSPEMVKLKKRSIGKSIPGGSLSVLSPDGTESFEGEETGEMIYRGENVTLGYAHHLNDLGRNNDNNGVLATGDIVYRDSDGFYFIVGRKSRFLKLYGIRVSLDEIEKMVMDHFEIECICFGNDQQMKVWITNEKYISGVKDLIVNRTSLFHQAIAVEFVAEIPRNETGKVIYN